MQEKENIINVISEYTCYAYECIRQISTRVENLKKMTVYA